MIVFSARRMSSLLITSVLLAGLSSPEQAAAYTIFTGNTLTVGQTFQNNSSFSINDTVPSDLVLQVNFPHPILEATLGVTLATDGAGGFVSSPFGLGFPGLALIQGTNTTPDLSTDADWQTLLALGDVVSHTGFGNAQKIFPDIPPGTAPLGSFQYIRVVFDVGELTARDTAAFSVAIQAVPEPSTLAMLIAGVLSIGFIARRRFS